MHRLLSVFLFCLCFSIAYGQTSITLTGLSNIAIISSVGTAVDVQTSSSLTNEATATVSAGYTLSVDTTTFPGQALVTVSSTSNSAASTLSGKGLLVSFLLCLLFICANIKGNVIRCTLFVMIFSLAIVYAAPSATVTVTVPTNAALNCLVLVVSTTTDSSVDCGTSNLTCSIATSANALLSNCACLKKSTATASLTAVAVPSSFSLSDTNYDGCSVPKSGDINITVTNTDATPSCLDFSVQFESSASFFNFNSIPFYNSSSTTVQCQINSDVLSCTAVVNANNAVNVLANYIIDTCCSGSSTTSIAETTVTQNGVQAVLAFSNTTISLVNSGCENI